MMKLMNSADILVEVAMVNSFEINLIILVNYEYGSANNETGQTCVTNARILRKARATVISPISSPIVHTVKV